MEFMVTDWKYINYIWKKVRKMTKDDRGLLRSQTIIDEDSV